MEEKHITMKANTNTKTKTILLKTDVVEKVEAMAKEENRNFSNMVETILMKATTPMS